MKTKDVAVTRCAWCGTDPLYVDYHDTEWGVPERDDRQLLAKLILDGAQAGLSWITILRKRDNYYRVFDNFDPARIASYDDRKRAELMADAGIVRNRLKIDSAITNARAFLELQQEISFSTFLWEFVGEGPIQNRWTRLRDIPAATAESKAMSRELKRRGFSFVGPTICYAFMQAVGMVNDHVADCFRHSELGGKA